MSESKIPLSEEELLQKPFYTVQEEEEPGGSMEIPDGSAAFSTSSSSSSQHINLLPSLAEAQSENYRELLPKLLLSVRIKNPTEFRNLTVSKKKVILFFLLIILCFI